MLTSMEGGEADDNYVKVIFDDVVMVMRKMNHPP